MFKVEDTSSGKSFSYRFLKPTKQQYMDLAYLCLMPSIERLNFYCYASDHWETQRRCKTIVSAILSQYFEWRDFRAREATPVSSIRQIGIGLHRITGNILDWIHIPGLEARCTFFDF
jgi:hypothetical protein